MDKLLSKEMILGSPFYPHDCGGMIECVTYKGSLKAMDEYAKQIAIAFYYWMEKENTIWRNEQGEPLTDDELYSLFELQNNVKP
jgi:hypothetical protein